jgi:TolA protein
MVDRRTINFHKRERASYFLGIGVSLFLHLFGALAMVLILQYNAALALKSPKVFSVTLEGGEVLGGISQVPDPKQQNKKARPPKAQPTPKPKVEAAKKAKIKQPTVVREKPKPTKTKKVIKKPKPKPTPAKKKATPKVKAKPTPPRETEAEKIARQKALDEQLKNAVDTARKRYAGESAKAGGQGFGAASLGGKGMGGGQVASIEFIAYRNALERHIKGGWRWLPGARVFQAQVLMRLTSNGTVQNASLISSSGNGHFDDSILRAVYKASPVPAPPARLYEQFKEVRITFNSHE